MSVDQLVNLIYGESVSKRSLDLLQQLADESVYTVTYRGAYQEFFGRTDVIGFVVPIVDGDTCYKVYTVHDDRYIMLSKHKKKPPVDLRQPIRVPHLRPYKNWTWQHDDQIANQIMDWEYHGAARVYFPMQDTKLLLTQMGDMPSYGPYTHGIKVYTGQPSLGRGSGYSSSVSRHATTVLSRKTGRFGRLDKAEIWFNTPNGHVNFVILLHEIAHVLDYRITKSIGHTPTFVTIYTDLLDHYGLPSQGLQEVERAAQSLAGKK